MFAEKLPTRYDAGSASVVAGQTTVTPTNAVWLGNAWGDDLFFLPIQPLVPAQRIETVNDDGTLTLSVPWPGASAAGADYEIRYVGMIERSTAMSRRVLEQLGEISAYYDVQIDTLADRAGYDSRPTGFRVLVSNIGDGRAAIYSKASSVDADWTDPAFFSGPVGPDGPIGPIGIDWKDNWDTVTTFALRDGVLHAGSSWRSLQNGNLNHAPPDLPSTSNAWWALVSAKGADGTGTGNVVGPASSVNLRLAAFSGTTGKLLADSGKTLADLAAELTPAGYADLLISVSLIALQVADNTNAAIFLGRGGNGFADSFDTMAYVDTVDGYANLNLTPSGALKAIIIETGVSGATGANIGNLTSGGGLAAAFNGADGAFAQSANMVSTGAGYVGKTYAGGKRISKVDVRSTTSGWDSSPGTVGTYVVRLYGKVGSAPASPTDGTLIGSNSSVADPGTLVAVTINSNDQTTVFDHVWVYISGNIDAATYGIGIGEATFFEAATGNLIVRSVALSAATVPTKMKAVLRVKEVDAAVAGTDYTLECSRDNAATWTTMALTELFTAGSPAAGIRVVDAAETSVSGQPSGTAVRWRFKTFNNKSVELHDLYLYWS